MGYEDEEARSDFVIASRQSVTWGKKGGRGKATMGKDTKQKGDREKKQWSDPLNGKTKVTETDREQPKSVLSKLMWKGRILCVAQPKRIARA